MKNNIAEVFISHSSEDKKVANKICEIVEEKGHSCWIAPRDLFAGEDYPTGIIRGIDQCKCMVVVLSGHANTSKHVRREVERAVDREITIIPLKIDSSMPTGSLDYFLKLSHWLDAPVMGMEEAQKLLLITIDRLLNGESVQQRQAVKSNKIIQNESSLLLKNVGLTLSGIVVLALLFWAWNKWGKSGAAEQDIATNTSRLEEIIQENSSLYTQLSKQNIASALEISRNIPNHAIDLKVWTEPKSAHFKQDKFIRFKVLLDRDAFLAVYAHFEEGDISTRMIYPNEYETPKKIAKDTPFTIGEDGHFKISEPFGVDVIHFIATTDRKELEKLLLKSDKDNGDNYPAVQRSELIEEMSSIKSRGIKIVGKEEIDNDASNKLWGEAIILLDTRP